MFDLSHHGSVSVGCEENFSIPKLSQVLNQNQEHKVFLIMHMNVRSLNKNVDKIENFLAMLPYPPEVIAICETKLKSHNQNSVSLPNYHFHCVNSLTNSGGIGLYLTFSLTYKIRPDLSLSVEQVKDIWVEIHSTSNAKPFIIGGVCFHLHTLIAWFQNALETQLENFNAINQTYYILV